MVNALAYNAFHLDTTSWKPGIVSVNCNKVSIIRAVLVISITEIENLGPLSQRSQ